MKWGRCGTIRYDGFVYYMEYDPKLYYPADVKEADAEFVKEQNDYLAERKRIPLPQLLQENIARLQKELEHSKYSDARRRRIFSAKSTAEDALFFLQYGITIAEAARGKAPKFFHVNCIVPNPLNDVVHGDNVQFEAKTVADTIVDDVVVVTTEEEIVIKAEIKPDVVEADEVVYDFNIADATINEAVIDTVVVPKVEVFVDTPDLHDTDIFATTNGATIFTTVDSDFVDSVGILTHKFLDPYLVHDDVSPYSHLSNYLVSAHGVVINYIQPQSCFGILLVQHGAHNPTAHEFKLFVRILFDPGIILGFLLKFHGVKLADADFYDIMLIRGRIIFIREGMIRSYNIILCFINI